MSAVVLPAVIYFPSPIVGCLHGNSFGTLVALKLPNQRHWTSPVQGKSGFSIIDIQHHHSCHLANVCHSYMPDGPEKAERRVTSQFTSDKNPVAGLYA